LFLADERFLDAFERDGNGLAQFRADAIQANMTRQP
jgi:hypothetical protein